MENVASIATQKLEPLTNMSTHPLSAVIALIAVMLIGLAWCFAGIHAKRAFSSIALGLGCFILGFILSSFVTIAGYEWILPLFTGIIGALVGGILPNIGMFVMISVSGVMALNFALEGVHVNMYGRLIIAIAVGIVFAVLGMKHDPAIMIASAFFGAFCFVGALSKNLQAFNAVPYQAKLGLGLGISIAGIVCQLIGTKGGLGGLA